MGLIRFVNQSPHGGIRAPPIITSALGEIKRARLDGLGCTPSGWVGEDEDLVLVLCFHHHITIRAKFMSVKSIYEKILSKFAFFDFYGVFHTGGWKTLFSTLGDKIIVFLSDMK